MSADDGAAAARLEEIKLLMSDLWPKLDAVTIDRDDAEEQLPTDRSACPPRLGVEGRTVCRVGHSDERRKLAVRASDGRQRRPDLRAAGREQQLDGQTHASRLRTSSRGAAIGVRPHIARDIARGARPSRAH